MTDEERVHPSESADSEHDPLAKYTEQDRIRLEELRREIQKGVDSLNRGEGIPADEAFAWIRAEFRARWQEQM